MISQFPQIAQGVLELLDRCQTRSGRSSPCGDGPEKGLYYDAAPLLGDDTRGSYWGLAPLTPVPHAAEVLTSVHTACGRMQQIRTDEHEIVLAVATNPTSFNAMLRTLQAAGEPRHLLSAVSNTPIDGEDFGWLWNVDFESVVPRLDRVTVSGRRADELATRLKYAGIDSNQ